MCIPKKNDAKPLSLQQYLLNIAFCKCGMSFSKLSLTILQKLIKKIEQYVELVLGIPGISSACNSCHSHTLDKEFCDHKEDMRACKALCDR